MRSTTWITLPFGKVINQTFRRDAQIRIENKKMKDLLERLKKKQNYKGTEQSKAAKAMVRDAQIN